MGDRRFAPASGDAIAAVFFLYWLRTGSAADALARAASAVFGVLERTAQAGAEELLLVDAQEELVNPTRLFSAEPI